MHVVRFYRYAKDGYTYSYSDPTCLHPSRQLSRGRVKVDNLLIHQPLQLFPPGEILFPDVALHVKVEEIGREGVGGRLVFRVVVCV